MGATVEVTRRGWFEILGRDPIARKGLHPTGINLGAAEK